ncbi:hypothetical protein C8A05DRAFT_45241 [Staphylotrichum tortipilum]|uniref:J domain-containing protein n=1 Tax=Staphylotrichum tortipilum TaxID=2831512 RepID=A0AAN6RRS8_9PEZI|nr:hypothetical protein C8A05DRAFT_45241 [Staphylotrichum longicolle]
MVKLDYTRDYYADLELSGPADAVEIKKQFKKLALKWHPDRNPGKEDEAKEKFLVIQAAHEILADPASKSKFDAYRQRAPRTSAASGVRGNPWQFTSEDVNRKFGPPPTRPPMPTRPPAPTAASTKYWEWAKTKAKMDHMRANPDIWERAGPQTKPTQPSAAAAGARTSKAREPPPTPRTASQARRQEAAFGTRKSGYAPASPMGDEPPVRNPHYNTNAGAGSRPAATSSTHAGNPRPASDFIDPLRAQFSETFLDNRRTPYAANVGEKTNPFEPLNVNRAKSMRDGSRKVPEDNTGLHPPPTPSRQRSASVDSEGLKNTGFTEPNPSPAPSAFQFPSRASARYSPRAPQPETNSAPATATFPDPHGSASSVNSSANATVNGGAAPEQSRNGAKVFSVPVDDQTTAQAQQARFTRNSADNINTRFVAEESGDANFQFNAGVAGAGDDGFVRAKQRARGQRSPLRNGFSASAEAINSSAPKPAPETGKRQSDFQAEQWKEAFGAHIFEPPLPPGKQSAVPTRANRPIKKPRSVRMTAGTAGMVDDEETSGEDKAKVRTPANGAANGINGSRSPNAMDIDTPPPEPTGAPANEPRTIHVEPTKPEWRAGNANVNANVNGGTHASGSSSAEPKLGAGLKMPQPVRATTGGSEDSEDFTARPIFAEFRNVEPFAQPKPTGLSSFADLSSNLPFPSRPAPKISLDGLGAHHEKAQPLELPTPPTAPRAPQSLCIPGSKPGAPAWLNYEREFEAYVGLWLAYNKKVTDHFATRQKVNQERGLEWLGARGDGQVMEYLRELETDKFVRQKWMATCEAHELHYKEFLACRERMVLGG